MLSLQAITHLSRLPFRSSTLIALMRQVVRAKFLLHILQVFVPSYLTFRLFFSPLLSSCLIHVFALFYAFPSPSKNSFISQNLFSVNLYGQQICFRQFSFHCLFFSLPLHSKIISYFTINQNKIHILLWKKQKIWSLWNKRRLKLHFYNKTTSLYRISHYWKKLSKFSLHKFY